jgi:hypothetical protein
MANIYKNAKLDLTTNTVTTLYTVPSNSRAIVKSILVCDDTNNGSNITVDLFNGDPASADKFTIFKSKTIGGNATEQLLTEPLIMEENEVLQVTAADANRLHVVTSILEINREDR